MSRDKLTAMVGLADSEGLESFNYFDKDNADMLNFMLLRARFNSHRDMLMYRVTMPEPDVHAILDLLNDGEYKAALVKMKKRAWVVEVAGKGREALEKIWERIPHFTHQEVEKLQKLLGKKPYKDQEIKQMTMFGDENE